MNLFGKNIPKAAQKGLVKIALLVVGICAFISIPVVLSLGWFASNDNTNANGMQVVVSTETYDILVARGGSDRYDASETVEGQPLYRYIGDMKTRLGTEGYDFVNPDAKQLAIELINVRDNVGIGYNLAPGSYGYATFYIRPHDPSDTSTVTISLQVTGYRFNGSAVVPADNENALNMLQGHLLFFAERTGALRENHQYSGLLNGGELAFTMDAGASFKSETNYYEITIYWEWPITYDEITDNLSTTSPAVTKKYPAELKTYIDGDPDDPDDNGHPQYFFASGASAVTSGKEIDSYNDGDQLIGDNINFVAVFIN